MRLQRVALLVERRGNVGEEHVEQRAEVVGKLVRSEPRAACSSVAVHDRKIDLGLVRVEVEEQFVHVVDDLVDPCVGPIDLVDDEDHRQPGLERLAQDEARLWQRPFARVHEQQHAVHHRQRALDLTTEVGVPRRVDDVDLDVAEPNGGVLGQDRDALLALEIHRVEDAVGDLLVLPKRPGLPEHRVDQRRLAMIDMRDDGYVTEILAGGHATRVARLKN